MDTKTTDIAERIEGRIDKTIAGALAIDGTGRAVAIAPSDMGEVMEFAKMMSLAGVAVRQEFRNVPGTCLALCTTALRWGMDPFAVAMKAYVVNDQIAFEAQLVHAVVNKNAPLTSRLRHAYAGEGPTRTCTIRGTIEGETEPLEYTSPAFKDIPIKNSPLWKNDPDQQLGYYSVRAWARRHVPEVLLGVYTPEEFEDGGLHVGAARAKDITPPPAPQRSEYDGPSLYALVDEEGEIIAEVGPKLLHDKLIGMITEPGADFHSIADRHEEQIERLKVEENENLYIPLAEVFIRLVNTENAEAEAAAKARTSASRADLKPGGGSGGGNEAANVGTGDGQEPANKEEDYGESAAADAATETGADAPKASPGDGAAIILEVGEDDEINWTKFSTDMMQAIAGCVGPDEVKTLMHDHDEWIAQLTAGNKNAATRIRNAAGAKALA